MEGYILCIKLQLYLAKFKTQKILFFENEKSEENWEEILKMLRRNSDLEHTIDKLDTDSSTLKTFTAVFRNLFFSIFTCLVIMRPNLHSLMIKTITKDIPYALECLAILSFVSVAPWP